MQPSSQPPPTVRVASSAAPAVPVSTPVFASASGPSSSSTLPHSMSTAGPSTTSAASAARIAVQSTYRWVSPDESDHSSSSSAGPSRSPHGDAPPRYEAQPARDGNLREKPLSRPASRASLSSSSEPDEKAILYHDDSVTDIEDPLRRSDDPSCPCENDSAPPRCSSSNPHILIEHQRHYGERVKGTRYCHIPASVKPWLPMCAWFATTIGFALAILFWKKQVFQGLDDLSAELKREDGYGKAVFFGLILITTFPPLPMYSTFMMLAGYTYGPITAFFISYAASLFGALIVFLIFRHFVPANVATSLLPPSLKRVVRAIEQRPSIFLLIRVAPYPYNVLNAVLGSSSTMTLTRYIGTTACSLLKVIVHTSLGSEIRSFKDLHAGKNSDDPDAKKEISWGEIWTGFGIFLCVVLFIYLSFVARRAVDEQLDDDEPAGLDGYTALPTTASPPAMASVIPSVASSNPFVVGGASEPSSPSSANDIPLPSTHAPPRRASTEEAAHAS